MNSYLSFVKRIRNRGDSEGLELERHGPSSGESRAAEFDSKTNSRPAAGSTCRRAGGTGPPTGGEGVRHGDPE
jgi:hypothetical protein